MTVAEDGVAAPGASVRAATGGDEGDGTEAVMGFPGVQVAGHINGGAVGPGLGGELFDLRPCGRLHHPPLLILENNALDGVQIGTAVPRQMRNQLFQCHFPFAVDDDVGAPRQVFGGVAHRLRATQDDGGPHFAADGHHAQDVLFGHQIAVEANERRPCLAHMGHKIGHRLEGGIVQIDGKPFGLKVGGDVEQPQRGVGLHNRLLVGVFGNEITVRKEDVHQPIINQDGGRVNGRNEIARCGIRPFHPTPV